jgi:hypothetical protein
MSGGCHGVDIDYIVICPQNALKLIITGFYALRLLGYYQIIKRLKTAFKRLLSNVTK